MNGFKPPFRHHSAKAYHQLRKTLTIVELVNGKAPLLQEAFQPLQRVPCLICDHKQLALGQLLKGAVADRD